MYKTLLFLMLIAPTLLQAQFAQSPVSVMEELTVVKHYSYGQNLALDVEGDIAYAAIGATMVFLDVSNPTEAYPFRDVYIGHYITAVEVYGSLMLVGASFGEVILFDVSDRHNPVELGRLEVPEVRDLHVVGNTLFIAAGFSGLWIADISDPANATYYVERLDEAFTKQFNDIEVVGETLYAARFYGGLAAYDISDLTAPSLISELDAQDRSLKIMIDGNLLYLASGTNGLHIYNIEDPANMALLGVGDTYGSAENVDVSGETAYVGTSSRNLEVFNVADPANQVKLDELGPIDPGFKVVVKDSIVFVASTPIRIINASDPENIEEIYQYYRSGVAYQNFVVGDHLVVTNWQQGVYSYDISNPIDIHLSSAYREFEPNEMIALTSDVANDHLYIPSRNEKMYVFNLSDPANLSAPVTVVEGLSPAVHSSSINDNLYCVAHNAGIDIYDISTPASPVFQATIAKSGVINGLALDGSTLYFNIGESGQSQTIETWSLDNPASPELIGEFTAAEYYFGKMVVEGNILYSVFSGAKGLIRIHGIRTIDISDPGNLSIIGEYNLGGANNTISHQIVVDNGLVYSPDDFKGLRVYDVSDPADVQYLTAIAPMNNGGTARATGVSVDGEVMYLSYAVGGIFVLHWGEHTFTNVERNDAGAVSGYELEQNYPNPFNPSTTLSFSIPESGQVNLTVFNVLGQEVAQLVSDQLAAGSYNVEFNGAGLPSGIYLYRISSGDYTATKKMMLLK